MPSSAFRKFERNMLVDVDRIAETHGEPASWTDSRNIARALICNGSV